MDNATKEASTIEKSSEDLTSSVEQKQNQRPSTKLLESLQNGAGRRVLESAVRTRPKCSSSLGTFKRKLQRHRHLVVVEKIRRGETVCEEDVGLPRPWYSHCHGLLHRFKEGVKNTRYFSILESSASTPGRVLEEEKAKSESHLILKIVIFCSLPVFYFLMNLALILYFFVKQRNKALRHITIWGMNTYGPVFFVFYLLLGASCCMWVFAFDYFVLYSKIYVPLSEIRDYNKTFKIVLIGAFVNNFVLFSGACLYAIIAGFAGQPISIYMFIAFAGIATIVNLIFSFRLKTEPEVRPNFFVKDNKYNDATIAFCNIKLGKKMKGEKRKRRKSQGYVLLKEGNSEEEEINIFEVDREMKESENLFKSLLDDSSQKGKSSLNSTNKTRAFSNYLKSIKY